MTALASSSPGNEVGALTTQLVDVAEKLSDLLGEETTFVRAMKIKEIGPLQPEKVRLTDLYKKFFKALTTANDGRALPTPYKERLASSGTRLAKAVIDNELALRVGKVATERLIGSIVTAVRNQKKATLSYAPQRRVPQRSFMTAAAVDRRL